MGFLHNSRVQRSKLKDNFSNNYHRLTVICSGINPVIK